MAEVVRRIQTDIRSTLITFKPGESKFIPYLDVVDENGNVTEQGSKTYTRVWDARYRFLKKEGLLEGTYKFRTVHNPDGTVICRID